MKDCVFMEVYFEKHLAVYFIFLSVLSIVLHFTLNGDEESNVIMFAHAKKVENVFPCLYSR